MLPCEDKLWAQGHLKWFEVETVLTYQSLKCFEKMEGLVLWAKYQRGILACYEHIATKKANDHERMRGY